MSFSDVTFFKCHFHIYYHILKFVLADDGKSSACCLHPIRRPTRQMTCFRAAPYKAPRAPSTVTTHGPFRQGTLRHISVRRVSCRSILRRAAIVHRATARGNTVPAPGPRRRPRPRPVCPGIYDTVNRNKAVPLNCNFTAERHDSNRWLLRVQPIDGDKQALMRGYLAII